MHGGGYATSTAIHVHRAATEKGATSRRSSVQCLLSLTLTYRYAGRV